MTPSEIQAAYMRALDVVNGFSRPSERIAKDLIALMKHYNSKPDPVKSKPAEMPDFMKDLFGFK